MAGIPNVVLNNGRNMPMIGLGTWCAPPGETVQTIKDAIDAGYRHIDCAYLYGNEREIGEGISAKIEEGVIKREDMFITSKLWNTFRRPDQIRGALEKTLNDLNITYIDLYLIHWPMAYEEEGSSFPPKNKTDKIVFYIVDYVDTWKELEKAVDDGLVKSIGISNFNKKQTERVLENCRIKPVTNQIECHPFLAQMKLSEFLRSKDIAVTAYSPLGSPSRPWATSDDPNFLEDPKLIKIAKKYNKTTAQILIRYQIDRGHIVIPKSVSKARMTANANLFDFKLDSDDIDILNSFDCNIRICPLAEFSAHPHYPFHDDY